jgi:hypothetical protein
MVRQILGTQQICFVQHVCLVLSWRELDTAEGEEEQQQRLHPHHHQHTNIAMNALLRTV